MDRVEHLPRRSDNNLEPSIHNPIYFLPCMVGYSNARYLLTTGQTYPAESSVLHRIFAELVSEPKKALLRAIDLVGNIATSVSLMAVHINRQLMQRNSGSIEGAHSLHSPLLYDMFGGRCARRERGEG